MLNFIPIGQSSKDLNLLLQGTLQSAGDDVADKTELLNWLSQLDNEEINTLNLIAWLNKTITLDKKSQFLLESLRAALLQDVLNALRGAHEHNIPTDASSNEELFNFLVIAGTIVAICEGFDAIASILGLFPAVPAVVIFVVGIVFAGLSVIVFCGFDLDTIAKHLGVAVGHPNHIIDVYLNQVEQIVKLREAISILSSEADSEKQVVLSQMATMLIQRYTALDEARNAYRTDLNASSLKIAKGFTSAVAGGVFFGSGFVCGQTVAVAIANLFTSSVATAFWPVFAASFVVGLAAFSIYWFLQRPGLESLVSRWLGLDEDKIDALINNNVVKDQLRELTQLSVQLEGLGRLHQQISDIKQTNELRDDLRRQETQPEIPLSQNRYNFHHNRTLHALDLAAENNLIATSPDVNLSPTL